MSTAKIVAILIPVITLVIWTYFFIVEKASINKFFLVVVLIPLALTSFYITLWLFRKIGGKPATRLVRS